MGVRHHGPGSARAVRAALVALAPDMILIEGPPEAGPLLRYVDALVPPVAVLAHATDRPGRAAFWPFADFSPEWQAARFAAETDRPVRFIDLPAATVLADDPEPGPADEDQDEDEEGAGEPGADPISDDPLAWLSTAA